MATFTLALIQMLVIGGDRQSNLKHAGERIKEAAQHGADIILLPEAMDLGWTDPSALTEAQSIPLLHGRERDSFPLQLGRSSRS